MDLRLEIIDSMTQVDAAAWNVLAGDMPLLSHAFLCALETSGSVGEGTGWQPCHMLVYGNDQLLGAMPLYLKYHSYGEYVFDWAWAEAYQQNGLQYYPKFVSAIPFTPITSQRLLAKNCEVQAFIVHALADMLHQHQLSSAHILFPDNGSAEVLARAGWLQRSLGQLQRLIQPSNVSPSDLLRQL